MSSERPTSGEHENERASHSEKSNSASKNDTFQNESSSKSPQNKTSKPSKSQEGNPNLNDPHKIDVENPKGSSEDVPGTPKGSKLDNAKEKLKPQARVDSQGNLRDPLTGQNVSPAEKQKSNDISNRNHPDNHRDGILPRQKELKPRDDWKPSSGNRDDPSLDRTSKSDRPRRSEPGSSDSSGKKPNPLENKKSGLDDPSKNKNQDSEQNLDSGNEHDKDQDKTVGLDQREKTNEREQDKPQGSRQAGGQRGGKKSHPLDQPDRRDRGNKDTVGKNNPIGPDSADSSKKGRDESTNKKSLGHSGGDKGEKSSDQEESNNSKRAKPGMLQAASTTGGKILMAGAAGVVGFVLILGMAMGLVASQVSSGGGGGGAVAGQQEETPDMECSPGEIQASGGDDDDDEEEEEEEEDDSEASGGFIAQTVSNEDDSDDSGGSSDTITLDTPSGSLTLSDEQVDNATAIVSTVESSDIDDADRAAVIALMTAWQESTMENLTGGDRDSEGLYQQRPSTGWGSSDEIRDPEASTLAFLGLADHTDNPGLQDIDGWQDMSTNDAAQAVQASGHPTEYAKWEPTSRELYEALTGTDWSGGDGSSASSTGSYCGLPPGLESCPPTDSPAEEGLTDDALMALRCVTAEFPEYVHYSGLRPNDTGSDHATGRAVDFMLSSPEQPWDGDYASSEGNQYGLDTAMWVQQYQRELGVTYIIWDDKIWVEGRDEADLPFEDWPAYTDQSDNLYSDDTLAHRDHPHVSVEGDSGTGFGDQEGNALPSDLTAGDGEWVHPAGNQDFTSTSGFGSRSAPCEGCSSDHKGHDFAMPEGADLYAVADGEVVTVLDEPQDARGRYVMIDVGDGVQVSYSHLEETLVSEGDEVEQGDIIGYNGTTGASTGPHLHFEVHLNGTQIDPIPAMKDMGIDNPEQPQGGGGGGSASASGWLPSLFLRDEFIQEVDYIS